MQHSLKTRLAALAAALMTAFSIAPPVEASEERSPSGDESRQVLIVALSWFTKAGNANCGIGYESCKAGGVANYPLPPGFQLPKYEKNPLISSAYLRGDEWLDIQRRVAEEDLALMKRKGFDVMLFDMLPMPGYDPLKPLGYPNEPFNHFKAFLEWVKAAEKTGMKAGIFADHMNRSNIYPKGRRVNKDEWVMILNNALDLLPDSPGLWTVAGAPGVMHFNTDATYDKLNAPVSSDFLPDGGWREVLASVKNSGRKLFFLADVRPHDKTLEWNSIADGAYIFAPSAPLSFLIDYQTEISKKFKIPYFWFVSSGNYRNPTYTEPDPARIHNAYLAAMKAGAKRVVVETWNDFEEDHDICPSVNKGSRLLDIYAFYNEWFKSGKQPAAEPERLILCYPVRIPETVSSKPPVWGEGKWAAPAYQPKVFYWANLKNPRRLSAPGLGESELPAGVSVGTLGVIGKAAFPQEEVKLPLSLDGKALDAPSVKRTKVETQRKGEGGLEFRYVDLL